jgi:cell division septation protein DedD
MLQSSERETEILLGNKQLLGIFFVGVVLLGIAFVGGYKVGQASAGKKTTAVETPPATNSGSSNSAQAGGETHSVPPEENIASSSSTAGTAGNRKNSEDLLGARKRRIANVDSETGNSRPSKADTFEPQSGQEFLQVAAVPHDHAVAVAAVLRKKGFHAHAVPKPGDTSVYRVIVGPIHDAGELSSTRDSLRKTGFSQVIVQHYQP